MADDIHAIILIAILIVTSIILIKYASPKYTWKNKGFVIIRFFIFSIFFISTTPVSIDHPSSRGGVGFQSWIIFLYIFLIAMLVYKRKVLYVSVGILLFMNVLLSIHYNSLLESHHFIGTEDYSTKIDERNQRKLVLARGVLSDAGESDKDYYPEGWLRDVINKPEHKKLRRELDLDSISSKQHTLWHSWVTGLYALEKWEISLWYPGGMLETSGPEVVYKIKDRKPNNDVEQTQGK